MSQISSEICCGLQAYENCKDGRTGRRKESFKFRGCTAVHTTNNLYRMLFRIIVSHSTNPTSTYGDNLRLWHEMKGYNNRYEFLVTKELLKQLTLEENRNETGLEMLEQKMY